MHSPRQIGLAQRPCLIRRLDVVNSFVRRERVASGVWLVPLVSLSIASSLFGAETPAIDESKLPAAATNHIEFVRDVQPIFAAHCLKCHGPERPKSGFRVDDRTLLLKGGDSGVDVFPGQSGRSPLIHFVAGVVADMEMPPKGKGEALTPAEIGVLRAWIDQGVVWGGEAPSRVVADVAPTFRWITVDGNERKFRELEWQREGFNGGLESFRVREQLSPTRRVTVEGHALRDDYQVKLSLEDGPTFVRAGFEQYRKYYGDLGGFYRPFTPPIAALDRDLFLDWGKAWVEAGGTLPNGLQLVAGYEFQFRNGDKSMTQWLPSTPAGGLPTDARSVLPTSKDIDEQVHVLRLDAALDGSNWRLEDRFRYEFYDLRTRHTSVLNDFADTSLIQRVRERDEMKTLANSFQGMIAPYDWLLFSAGYMYRHIDGTADIALDPQAGTGGPGIGYRWNTLGIPIEQSGHVANVNAQLLPLEGLVVSTGVQTEWNRQESLGRVNLDDDSNGPLPATVTGNYDRFIVQENAGIRFTRIPFTVLYGEARLQQEDVRQFEALQTDSGLGLEDSLRKTDATYDWKQVRAGFNVSPWSRVSLNSYYQYRDHDDDFDHRRDERPPGNTSGVGYPAFITARETRSDEVGVRLVLRPNTWLKTTLSYRVVATDFHTATDASPAPDDTPGGGHLAGNSDAHIYSINATLTPWRRLYLFTTFSYENNRTVTADNLPDAVVAYQGNVYSVMATASYVLSDPTDVHLTYDFSHGDYSQHNVTAGLPLGIDYQRHGLRAGLTHRFWKRFAARAEYAWFLYEEPSGGGYGDYQAHGIFGTLAMRWD